MAQWPEDAERQRSRGHDECPVHSPASFVSRLAPRTPERLHSPHLATVWFQLAKVRLRFRASEHRRPRSDRPPPGSRGCNSLWLRLLGAHSLGMQAALRDFDQGLVGRVLTAHASAFSNGSGDMRGTRRRPLPKERYELRCRLESCVPVNHSRKGAGADRHRHPCAGHRRQRGDFQCCSECAPPSARQSGRGSADLYPPNRRGHRDRKPHLLGPGNQ